MKCQCQWPMVHSVQPTNYEILCWKMTLKQYTQLIWFDIELVVPGYTFMFQLYNLFELSLPENLIRKSKTSRILFRRPYFCRKFRFLGANLNSSPQNLIPNHKRAQFYPNPKFWKHENRKLRYQKNIVRSWGR